MLDRTIAIMLVFLPGAVLRLGRIQAIESLPVEVGFVR
jgi:hypothetical protein